MEIIKKKNGYLLELEEYEAFDLVNSIDTGSFFAKNLLNKFKEHGVWRED